MSIRLRFPQTSNQKPRSAGYSKIPLQIYFIHPHSEGNNQDITKGNLRGYQLTIFTFHFCYKSTIGSKRCLFLGRKTMTDLDSILKSRDITLLTKVCIVKAMAFPVVVYGYESRTIKKVECQRTDAFELWCWRRLSRVPWTARRSNQSILKEISPGCSLEGLMLKLKL